MSEIVNHCPLQAVFLIFILCDNLNTQCLFKQVKIWGIKPEKFLQCVNGIYRVYDLVENAGENVAWLDSQDWYVATSTSLDLISLACVGGALKEALATWRAMKSVSSLKATEWLRNYPRQDRARLTELIIRAQNRGITNKELKAAIRAGLYPKRFPVEPVQKELVKQLAQVVTSAAAMAGSAVSGIIAAPGNVPRTGRYIVGTIQSLAVF